VYIPHTYLSPTREFGMMKRIASYSNAQLTERIQKAIKPFDAQVVSLELKHEATVQRFISRVEDMHRRSRETPVKLRRD